MARTGENIFKRKDGRWEARYIKGYSNGRAIYAYVFGKTYSEAKRKKSEIFSLALSASSMSNEMRAKKKIEEKLEKTEKVSDKKSDKMPLVKELAFQWLNDLKAIRKKSTISKYEAQIQNYIIPTFGNKRIDEVCNEDIIKFANALLSKGINRLEKLSSRSVSDILTRMKSIRKFALLHNFDVKFFPNCVEIPKESKVIRVLSVSEEELLINHIKLCFNRKNMGILLCLFTGIRIGELCALKWSDFSFEDKELNVKRTMQRIHNFDKNVKTKTSIEIGKPKSQNSIRAIPIPDDIFELIRPYYVEDAYFLTGQKKTFIEPRTMEAHFKSVLKRCGIEDANFHSLRHTFATRCVEAGFDAKSLSEILGHASVNITLNRYVHPTMELKRKNMEKLSNLFAVE